MSLWAILAAPLILGNDVTSMDANTLAALSNPEIIAVDQDQSGSQGKQIIVAGTLEIWAKPLHDGSTAVVMLDRGASSFNMTLNFSDIHQPVTSHVRDLWAHQDLGAFSGSFTANVPSHGAYMVIVRP
jgi:alpha-galactosidase